MRKFVTFDCLVDSNEVYQFSNRIQNLRQAVLTPVTLKPNILRALQQREFRFHRTCSFSSLIRECNVEEGQILLMYWGQRHTDSRVTMSDSSCSSFLAAASVHSHRERELRSIAQQTEISCRHPVIPLPPANPAEPEDRLCRLGDLAYSSPASSLLSPPLAGRSMSILGSVCALLLNKQGSSAAAEKEVSSYPGSPSDNICRICFGGESAERLVRPCSCRGTIAAVHRVCLERWLLQASTSYCELCRHHYVVTRSHKWSWIRSLIEWARSGRGRALAGDAWRGAALGAASVLGTARALHACDRVLQAGARRGGGVALAANLFSSLLIGVIGALNGLLTTWMLLKIQEHQLSWQSWRDSTLHVHVTLSGEAPTEGAPTPTPAPSATPSDATVVAPQSTTDRSTNVADPFMVALPYTFPDF